MHNNSQQSCFSSKPKLDSRKPENTSLDWATLPEELLDVILGKLVCLSDYIGFGSVCKSWHSVAIDQKECRIATMRKRPPMLLFKRREECRLIDGCRFYEFKLFQLYSISEGKFYQNHGPEAPREAVFLGSSYGWCALGSKPVAFQEEEEKDSFSITALKEEVDGDDEIFYLITLFNPFTQKSIQKPRIYSGSIRKIILSCNPTTCPGDFALAALVDNYHNQVAFLRAGENIWTFADTNEEKSNLFFDIKDIIFHNGLLYALDYCNRLIAIDYKHSTDDDQNTPAIVIVPRMQRTRDRVSRQPPWSYLVEASNGDLLLVQREHSNYYQETGGKFKVYKLEANKTALSSLGEEEVEWMEIEEFENNDTIFLGDNTSLCLPEVSCYPDYERNSIYFAQNLDLGIFDIGSREQRVLDGLEDSQNHMLPIAWISQPILC